MVASEMAVARKEVIYIYYVEYDEDKIRVTALNIRRVAPQP